MWGKMLVPCSRERGKKKQKRKDQLFCLWWIFIVLNHGYKTTLRKGHTLALTSRAGHESKDLY